jgi:hypothetical protein
MASIGGAICAVRFDLSPKVTAEFGLGCLRSQQNADRPGERLTTAPGLDTIAESVTWRHT